MVLIRRKIKKHKIYLEIFNLLSKKYSKRKLEKKRVLWAEWFTDGREIEQMKLIIIFLRDVLNWDIDFISQFDPMPTIFQKYDFAIISGIIGGTRGINWAKSIFRDSSIQLFVSETEGIYRSNLIEQFVWGNLKKEKVILWTKCAQWSQVSNSFMKSKYPLVEDSYFISGSLGVDNYVISDKVSTKYDFGIALNADLRTYEAVIVDYGKEFANKWLNDFHKEANKEIINFIKIYSEKGYKILIKPHPLLGIEKHNVIKGIIKNKNISIKSSTYPIEKCIKESKIWICQNSSSALEALTFKKPVFRSGNYKPPTFVEYDLLPKLEDLKKDLNNGKTLSKIKEDYNKNSNINEEFIKNTVGYIDGFNHLRFIKMLLENIDDKINRKFLKLNKYLIKYIFINLTLKIARIFKIKLPHLFEKRFDRNKPKILIDNINRSSKKLQAFYASNKSRIIKILN